MVCCWNGKCIDSRKEDTLYIPSPDTKWLTIVFWLVGALDLWVDFVNKSIFKLLMTGFIAKISEAIKVNVSFGSHGSQKQSEELHV